MEVGSPVQLINYETFFEGQKLPLKKRIILGTIDKVLPDGGDGIEKFVVNREPGEELYEYAAFSEEGFILGHTMINKRPGYSAQEGKCFVVGSLIPQIRGDEMLPDIGSAFVDVIGSSEGEVDFRFAVRVDDPLHLLGENITTELAVEYIGHQRYIQPGTYSKYGPYRLLMKNPQVVPLNSGKLDEADLENIKLVRGYPGDDFLLGEASEKLPRAPNLCSFQLQLILRDKKSGEVIYGRPLRVVYDINLIKQKPVQIAAKQETKPISPAPKPTPPVSKPTPSVSKPALTVPVLEAGVNGEVKLTSAATRLEAKASDPAEKWPEPEDPAEAITGRLASEEELSTLDAMVLDLPERSFIDTEKCGAFSADGKSIYLLDRFGNLRKLLAEDLSCQKILKIPDDINTVVDAGKVLQTPIPEHRQLILTQAGVVVSFNKKHKLWVIHPETLEVLREIPVDSPKLICGNLETGIGFCIGRWGPKTRATVPSPAMLMIDFETGLVVHCIYTMDRNSRKNLLIPTPRGEVPLADFDRKIEMTDDGRMLYAGGRAGIAAFRLDDRDLYYESSTLPKQVTIFNYWGFSSSGKWVAGASESSKTPEIFSADNLTKPYFTIPRELLDAGIQSIAHDSQQDVFYLFKIGSIMALRLDNKEHSSYRSQIFPIATFVSPTGSRLAICGPKSFALIHLPGS